MRASVAVNSMAWQRGTQTPSAHEGVFPVQLTPQGPQLVGPVNAVSQPFVASSSQLSKPLSHFASVQPPAAQIAAPWSNRQGVHVPQPQAGSSRDTHVLPHWTWPGPQGTVPPERDSSLGAIRLHATVAVVSATSQPRRIIFRSSR